jgi:RNA polymerase sigma-70 factor (ECF subfamily)
MLPRDLLTPGAPLAGAGPGCISSRGGADENGSAPGEPGEPAAGEAPRTSSESPLGSSLAAWFHESVEGLWRLVVRLGVPAHSADDIVQEAFIIANRRSADIASGQERSFLTGTAVRLCSNYRQKAHVRREIPCLDSFEGAVSPTPDAEQLLIERRWRERLDRVLAELSDAHRAPFVLYELEGFSVPEIAELLALPLGTVSSRLWRARARFSELAMALYGSSWEEER